MESGGELMRSLLKDAYHGLKHPSAVVKIPHSQSLAGKEAKGHFHLNAELFLQMSGATLFRFPGEEMELLPGEALIVPSLLYHAETVISSEHPFLNIVVAAGETSLSCHLANEGPSKKPRIHFAERLTHPSCRLVALELQTLVQAHQELGNRPQIVVDLLISLVGMTLCLLEQPTVTSGQAPLVVTRCQQMIHESLGDPSLSVGTLAQRLGCNADYLSHLFRTVQGEKMTGYIEELRLNRAAQLLSQTNLSCKEVAWASGYANQSYFIRCFRKRWGTSPLDWRQTRP